MDNTTGDGKPDVDPRRVMTGIGRKIEEKRKAGKYDDHDLTAVKAQQLENFKTDEAYLDYYLKSTWQTANIDLGDFKIESKSRLGGRPVVWLKKTIWKLLKFYTFRLFSQQKEFNAMVAGTLQGMSRKFDRRLAALEKEIERLNEKLR